VNDTYRTRRTAVIGACAFVAIVVAILGIHHV
jgi:preprotein translocase subunit Sec61beta